MEYIIVVSASIAVITGLKYRSYIISKANNEGYQRGYAMAYFAKQATPFVIRNEKGERVNVQVTDHHEKDT